MESMDMDCWNHSSDSQMKLINMMLELENLGDLSELSSPSSPAYCSNPMSPTSPALLAGPQHPLSFNNGTAIQESGLMFGANPTSINATSASPSLCGSSHLGHDADTTAAMREVMYRIAAMHPVQIDTESAKPPKRRNVRISTDPQSVAARHRRERISERMRILQQMVPGGTKMDTASMLDEAIHYVKFLKSQVQTLELVAAGAPQMASGFMSGAGDQYYSGYGGEMHQVHDHGAFMNSAYIWNN